MDTQTLIRLRRRLSMTAPGGPGVRGAAVSTSADLAGRNGRPRQRRGVTSGPASPAHRRRSATQLLKSSIPGLAILHHVGLLVLDRVPRGLRPAVRSQFPHSVHRPLGRLGFVEDFFTVAVLLGISRFAIIRLRSEPRSTAANPAFMGRTPVAPGHPVHDLQRHLDLRAGPRGRGRTARTCPTATARSSAARRPVLRAARPDRQRMDRDGLAAAARRGHAWGSC